MALDKVGPFRFDTNTNRFLNDGRELQLGPQALKAFAVLAQHSGKWLTWEELGKEAWGNAGVSERAVRATVSRLRASLGAPYDKCILQQRNKGFQFSLDSLLETEAQERVSASMEFAPELRANFEIRPDIKACLADNKLALDVVDEYIELGHDVRGWSEGESVFCPLDLYVPTDSFNNLMARFSAKPPIREYYGLQDIESRAKDDERKLIIYAEGSDWRHIFAVNEVTKNIQKDDECRKFRAECEKDLTPGIHSRLYRHINCESLVITSDNYIVLGRRPTTNRSGHPVHFSPGAWTASLEEQMLRRDPDGETPPDKNLFDCVERSLIEELKVRVDRANIRLLSYGVEWANFTAAFLFLVKTPADLVATMKAWTEAEDRIEAIALDGLPANSESIRAALSQGGWSPSTLAKTWKGGDSIAAGSWHPTARARLWAYLRYVEQRSSSRAE